MHMTSLQILDAIALETIVLSPDIEATLHIYTGSRTFEAQHKLPLSASDPGNVRLNCTDQGR